MYKYWLSLVVASFSTIENTPNNESVSLFIDVDDFLRSGELKFYSALLARGITFRLCPSVEEESNQKDRYYSRYESWLFIIR